MKPSSDAATAHPLASNNAAYAASSPAMRDEWATAARAPASEPPIFNATTSLPAACACNARRRKRAPSSSESISSAMTRVGAWPIAYSM